MLEMVFVPAAQVLTLCVRVSSYHLPQLLPSSSSKACYLQVNRYLLSGNQIGASCGQLRILLVLHLPDYDTRWQGGFSIGGGPQMMLQEGH